MQTIAALLTVFNRKDKTIQCLSNLFHQNGIDERFHLDVFLTNDGCTDGTPEAVREQFPQVNIVEGDGNLFWNRGMLKAWSEAAAHKDYEYYLWLNDDTFIYNDCIEQLLYAASISENKGTIVGSTCAVGCNSVVTYGGRIRGKGLVVPNGELQEVNLLNGNILLIPRYVFERVGMNDPVFRHAIGDNDYGLRVIEAGLKNYVAPKILGECNSHETEAVWKDAEKPLAVRWKALRKPTGVQPEEHFIYEKRHFGLGTAMFHYFTVHLRCLCPWIWKILKRN